MQSREQVYLFSVRSQHQYIQHRRSTCKRVKLAGSLKKSTRNFSERQKKITPDVFCLFLYTLLIDDLYYYVIRLVIVFARFSRWFQWFTWCIILIGDEKIFCRFFFTAAVYFSPTVRGHRGHHRLLDYLETPRVRAHIAIVFFITTRGWHSTYSPVAFRSSMN